MDIAIVGAGLGGLMTALRLEQQGHAPRIHEATPELRLLGVGIAVQPDGTKEFEELGLRDRPKKISVDAGEPIYYNQYGQEIHEEKCGVHRGYARAQRAPAKWVLKRSGKHLSAHMRPPLYPLPPCGEQRIRALPEQSHDVLADEQLVTAARP